MTDQDLNTDDIAKAAERPWTGHVNDSAAYVKADTQDVCLMTKPDAELVAAVSADTTARSAHHEAGHAVAAVFRGGELLAVHLGHVDWSTFDNSADRPGETHHRTRREVQPFVTFAGPWATARWTVEHDPEVDDFDQALELAWNDQYDGDGAKYRARVEKLTLAAAQLGFPSVGRYCPWEYEWTQELDLLWPAVCEVAALLIDGQPVTHDDVLAAVERIDAQLDS